MVYEWTVVIRPRTTPKLSSRTLATGARQLVVQDPFGDHVVLGRVVEVVVHPHHHGQVLPLGRRADEHPLGPAVMCPAALALSVKSPVHSSTMSTPSAFQGSSARILHREHVDLVVADGDRLLRVTDLARP